MDLAISLLWNETVSSDSGAHVRRTHCDDSLEDYSEALILRWLSGEELPARSNGSNNQYFLYEVSESYARMYPRISYHDEMVYITEKDEEEPARVLTTIFEAEGNRFMELVVYTPTIEKADLQRAILGWIVFLYVLLLLAVILLNVWVFRRNMHPLYRLLAWLDAYRLGRSNAPLENNTRIYEFRKLNEAVTLSAERSEKLYEQQKLFIGNASHEMQTPLAICRNRLEMLMEEGNLSERQLEELIKTHETLERLTRLNRSLLLLCKIENRQFSDVKDICYNHLLEQYLEDYKEVYAYRGVSVEVITEGEFTVMMSESLASVLLTNLLKNAFVHVTEGGVIRILFTTESMVVANSGEQPLDGEHIFERFYQGHKKEGSTGLGLALAESVCKSSGLDIRYEFTEGMHRFTVSRSGSERVG